MVSSPAWKGWMTWWPDRQSCHSFSSSRLRPSRPPHRWTDINSFQARQAHLGRDSEGDNNASFQYPIYIQDLEISGHCFEPAAAYLACFRLRGSRRRNTSLTRLTKLRPSKPETRSSCSSFISISVLLELSTLVSERACRKSNKLKLFIPALASLFCGGCSTRKQG